LIIFIRHINGRIIITTKVVREITKSKLIYTSTHIDNVAPGQYTYQWPYLTNILLMSSFIHHQVTDKI